MNKLKGCFHWNTHAGKTNNNTRSFPQKDLVHTKYIFHDQRQSSQSNEFANNWIKNLSRICCNFFYHYYERFVPAVESIESVEAEFYLHIKVNEHET